MKLPFAVIYRNDEGREVIERYHTAPEVNVRLNELWGHCGYRGPERHAEARGLPVARIEKWWKWR
jgi:hypothetical protein